MSRPRSAIEALWGSADSRFTYDPDTMPEARRDLIEPHPHDFDAIDELIEALRSHSYEEEGAKL